MLGTRTLLGLSIDEFGIVVAEVSPRSGRPEVHRAGHWRFEEKLNLDNAKALGQQLKQFLRANHFSSKQAVIGIPTKWVIAKEITIPPAGADALAGVLNIQAERAFSLNASELVFDYCGRTSASERSDVLLLAARREIVNQVKELAAGAGLQVRSMTVSALAFGKMLPGDSLERRYGLYTRPTYCEFWTQVNGSPRSIQHVSLASTNGTTDDRAELLTSTIQRLLLLSSQQDAASPQRVTAYDGSGLPEDRTIERLNERLQPQIIVTDGGAQLLPDRIGSPDRSEQAQSIAAVAVAMAASGTDRAPVDFVNPRIGLKKKTSRKPITVWASIVGAACLLALIAVAVDWQIDRRDIATYTEQLDVMSEDIAAAREVVDRITYATSWTSQEPVFLNFMRELTLTFPEEPTIWVTNLRLNDSAGAALVGKASTEESFYEVLDKIKQQDVFSNVQMIHLRNVGRDLREKEFAVNFEYRGMK
ncbi:MAG: pilus assembly protein PilM [Sedimentisphaerales bacterium]|nr:pilus assembly protein PilM [Sedimentisphaerales bacterium]